MSRPPATLLELLELRAQTHSDRPLYTFIRGDTLEEPPFGALYTRALRAAVEIAAHAQPGDRALLLFPFGETVLVGLMGALLAGVVSVPLPIGGRRGVSFAPAAQDSGARLVLTDAQTRARLEPQYAAHGLTWVAVDALEGAARGWQRPPTTPEDLAWLQYTSGSTGAPRGVRVRHGNALVNSRDIALAWGLHAQSRSVMWVPHYHDDGLVNGLLQPLYSGFRAALMDPLDFIARPDRWLRWISRLSATHAGGPNFTYAVTLRKVGPEAREGLDLGAWEMAYNAAEPVRADTLRSFHAAFAPCGLRWSTLRPAYGMAETTLLVTTSPAGTGPLLLRFDAAALRERGVALPAEGEGSQELASSGQAVPGTQVRIWDPEQRTPVDDGRVGEILVQGPGVTGGYWNRPEVNADLFGATLPDAEGVWLRTGDLGFLREGELFVTSRLKDLILIAGANYAPQDVEAAVEASDPAFRPGCAAAFGVPLDAESGEGVVVVAEVRDPPPGEAARLARRAQEGLGAALGLQLHALVLLAPEHLPKTSSGKVRRRPTRQAYLDGTLAALDRWERGQEPGAPSGGAELRALVLEEVARRAGIPAEQVDPALPFAALGLRSLDAVALAESLSEALGRELSVLTLFDHPTVDALLAHLTRPEPSPPRAERGEANEPIAVVGMACRLPGAADVEALWSLLREGGDAIREVPEARWRLWEEWDPGIRQNPRLALRTGGFLDELERFDAAFFGISPREASRMDPQQRLALALTWEALADAGIPPEALAGTAAGVFAGALDNEYGRRLFSYGHEALVDSFAGTGGSLAILANRLSYVLDTHGPSLSVDTACSSGLVALHLAVQSLRRGESSLAVVLATNLLLTPGATVNFSLAGALSRGGRPRPFDAGADGFVRAEGAVVLICKRLAEALADGDRIHAVVRGSAVVQDGRTNGLMAPSQSAQEATLRAALRDAGVQPHELSAVETHGTGTPLGDPIEARALGAVFGPGRERPLWLGAAKANLGHLEAAAGLVGVVKAALSLERRELTPIARWEAPNPLIDLEGWGLAVPTAARPWEGPLRVGVSAFGFGGTNAHAVLEAAPERPPPGVRAEGPWVLPLSARSRGALEGLAQRWRARLEALGPDERLADLLYTASVRRGHEPWRAAVVGADAHALAQALQGIEATAPARASEDSFWLCSGHGSQWAGMPGAVPLPAFEQGLEAALGAVRAVAGAFAWPLSEADLDRVDRVQPAIFAIQIALGSALEALGLRPAGVLGHSLGEVAAACLAGVLTLTDGARVVVERSRLMARVEGQGAMLAVPLAGEEALALGEGLSVAVESGPQSSVLAGTPAAIAALERALAARGVQGRRVRTGVAFHSPQMDPLTGPLRDALQGIRPRRAAWPLWSATLGARVEGPELGPEHWALNLRAPVRLGSTLAAMAGDSPAPRLELAPHPVLASAARSSRAAYMPTLRSSDPPLAWVAALYRQGLALRWSAVYPAGAVVTAPLAPWQPERHWVEVPARDAAPAPLLGSPPRLSPGETRRWTADLAGQNWLTEHRLHGQPLAPAALVLEVARAAGEQALGRPVRLERVVFEAPWFPERQGFTLETVVEADADGARFTLLHPQGRFAHGSLRALEGEAPIPPALAHTHPLDVYTFHEAFGASGLSLGPTFRAVRALRGGEDCAEAELSAPEGLHLGNTRAHPALLDAALRVAAAARPLAEGGAALPVGVGGVRCWGPLGATARVLARTRSGGPGGELEADLWVLDPRGQVLLEVEALRVRPVQPGVREDRLYEATWESRPAAAAPGTAPIHVVPDRGGRAKALAEALEAAGVGCSLGPAEAAPGTGPVVDLRALDLAELPPGEGLGALSAHLVGLARLVHARPGAQLCVVLPEGVAGEAVAGGLRAARLERPDTRLRALTVEADLAVDDWLPALLHDDGERELRVGPQGRAVRRLVPAKPSPGEAPGLGGAVVVSGGLGGLGRLAAAELARLGARELVLIGRSAPGAEALAAVEALRAGGCAVEVLAADVADEDTLRRALAGRQVAGVVHTAGVLHDAPLAAQDPARVEAVLRPKLGGALALHRLAPEARFFILFGSVAGLWGNAGQLAYSAANAALVGFAAWRRAQGLPALCLEWGPWAEVGMAAREGVLGRAESLGLGALSPTEGAALFARLLAVQGAGLGVVAVDWTRFGAGDPLFERLHTPTQPATDPGTALREAVAAAFQLAPDALDPDMSLVALGLDSVIALDLKSRLQRAVGLDLPVSELLRGPSTRELLARLPSPAPQEADVDGLSDAEVEALLQQLLAQDGT